jgi:processive 1,2-diacylglycerol beta-glucosyltransferase
VRVLIFSAGVGEGHELPARVLAEKLRFLDKNTAIEIIDTIAVRGSLFHSNMHDSLEFVIKKFPWMFDLQYWFATRFAPTRTFASRLLGRVGREGLMREIVRFQPDVIVSTYPAATEVLGALKVRGVLQVPLISAVTDLAALRYWAHPGCDLHLVTHSESAEEIREIAGVDTRIEHVRGLTDPVFEVERDQSTARKDLNLPMEGPLVLVSGGGWGVGDLEGAIEAGLASGNDVNVVALCGRSEEVRTALTHRFADEPRVRVVGFTEVMGEFMAAADVLVHSTAGLTVLEALIRGVRVISYGWGRAHIRLNNEAYQRFGMAEVARDRQELSAALARALDAPGKEDSSYGDLPDASEFVVALGKNS